MEKDTLKNTLSFKEIDTSVAFGFQVISLTRTTFALANHIITSIIKLLLVNLKIEDDTLNGHAGRTFVRLLGFIRLKSMWV